MEKLLADIKNKSYIKEDVIYLGNFIEVKPIYDGDKLAGIVIYKYTSPEDMEDDDYDFDGDYITTIYA